MTSGSSATSARHLLPQGDRATECVFSVLGDFNTSIGGHSAVPFTATDLGKDVKAIT